MSLPCGIFSHYLKLLLCVLKFQNPSKAPTTMGTETKDSKKKKKYNKALVSIKFLHTPAFSPHPSSPYMFFNASPKPPFHLPMQVQELPAEEDWRCRAVLILRNSEGAEWPLHDQNALSASRRDCACVSECGVHVFKKKKRLFLWKEKRRAVRPPWERMMHLFPAHPQPRLTRYLLYWRLRI